MGFSGMGFLAVRVFFGGGGGGVGLSGFRVLRVSVSASSLFRLGV